MTVYIAYYIIIIALYFLLKQVAQSRKFTLNDDLERPLLAKGAAGYRRIFAVLSVGLLICLLGFRSPTMGIDLENYFSFLEDARTHSWRWILSLWGFKPYRGVETGYWYLMKILASLGVGNQGLIFICATLSLIPVGMLIYRNSKNPLVALIVLLGTGPFLYLFSAVRQVLAMSILICAFPYIKKGKFLSFCLVVLMASLIHFSALLFFPAYFLYGIKLNRGAAYITAALLPVMWILQKPIFILAVKITGYGDGATMDTGAGTLFWVYMLVYFFCLYMGDRNDPLINGTSNLFWVACAIQSMSGVSMLVTRIGIFYVIYLTILLPNVLEQPRLKTARDRRIVSLTVSLCFILYGLYAIQTASWPESYPYSFFWAS